MMMMSQKNYKNKETERMKKQRTIVLTMLSEKLDSKTLMSLVGGADANPIRTYPHDLVTPASSTEPYTDDDPDKD